MKILFHANHLTLRGTEVALFDYADYNETLLGNTSIIAVGKQSLVVAEALEKFKERFQIYFYESLEDLQGFVNTEKIELFYMIKAGFRDSLVLQGCKNCVHAVFKYYEPHGDVYAYVSEWLSQEMSNGAAPFVPHIVTLPDVDTDLREELGIPTNSIVFGRYGGMETFDIPFVKRAVYSFARKRQNVYFLFMNTENFLAQGTYFSRQKVNKVLGPLLFPEKELPNIRFIPGSSDPVYKRKFINACDAMLHSRRQGESFGLSCGEFSISNKPVITCNASFVSERCHIAVLGEKGLYYATYRQLARLLRRFKPQPERDWDAYSSSFSPAKVMKKFKSVFVD